MEEPRELKNVITESRNSVDGLNSRLDISEERISELEDREKDNFKGMHSLLNRNDKNQTSLE